MFKQRKARCNFSGPRGSKGRDGQVEAYAGEIDD